MIIPVQQRCEDQAADSAPVLGRTALAAACMSGLLLLAGCSHPVEPVAALPKPVKIETVGAFDAGQGRGSFVGTVRAQQRGELSFETAGRVAAVLVEVGDRVRAGQELARLDPAPARWRLDKAAADDSAAVAALAERDTQLRQQEALSRDGIISPAALETVRAAHALASSQRGVAQAALAAARRDVALTRITAPFAGAVVARLVQPFADVAPGQAIVQVQSEQAQEVLAMLPDTVASGLAPDAVARARSGNRDIPLTLERLSARSDNGSLVQAIFKLAPGHDVLRNGAVVAVELPDHAADVLLSVPMAAVMTGARSAQKPGQASVFVLDKTGTLVRRPVQTGTNLLPGSRMEIRQGVQRGDQVVVAGTAFLHEGQAAVAHQPQTLLQGDPR
ncbi:efflux RND transporter periplasmic adaptor subunit [Janthinobacterium aquaticum]|uniref:efflux RND transporter periplasmic adaptor subunit n=1 Tax=Janthinobacterium sp. FT58W TaxID=2654254 RepID=UPI0012653C39|nr:efflux RND transporter periplasmic adaptor subunit [Janthinobacterium sp. FT58W]KAB8035784.1 efflux RND transporter periplasmic adaptor subunit [Janthinobacterium sp. FT58W]